MPFRLIICTALIMTMLTTLTTSSKANAQPLAADRAALCQIVHEQLTMRQSDFTITVPVSLESVFDGDIDRLLQEIYAVDIPATSDDYDYLLYNMAACNLECLTDGLSSELHFSISYRETPEQLAAVRQAAAQFTATLAGQSDFAKIKAVHDFVVTHTAYDNTLTKFTAYNALIEQSAVCHGYTALTYKLLTDVGITCRCISGEAGGEPHSWNIVRLDGHWYALDTTWDDITGQGSICRDYFLVGAAKLRATHQPEVQFQTPQFAADFPLSEADYKYTAKM